jgi:hypothetical protein
MSKLTILTAAAALSCSAIGLAHADEETPRSRAEVIAELDAARSSGEQDALLGEDSGSAWLAQQAQPSQPHPSIRAGASARGAGTRRPVRADRRRQRVDVPVDAGSLRRPDLCRAQRRLNRCRDSRRFRRTGHGLKGHAGPDTHRACAAG